MKRYLLLIIVLCFFITGCGEKEYNKKDWQTDFSTKESLMDAEIRDIFNRATKNSDKSYKLVALLATQIVAGSNYMFLTIEDNTSYKILVINNDLENKATILYNNDFDYTKYVFENFQYKPENLSGGWNVFSTPMLSSTKQVLLDSNIQNIFDEASKKIEGTTYLPIATLGHLDEDGTKYAILCYGIIDSSNSDEGIFLVTLYDQSNSTKEIVSNAYVDLTKYAK